MAYRFKSFNQAIGQGLASGLNANQARIFKISVIFNELVGKTVKDEVEFLLRKDDPAGSHWGKYSEKLRE